LPDYNYTHNFVSCYSQVRNLLNHINCMKLIETALSIFKTASLFLNMLFCFIDNVVGFRLGSYRDGDVSVLEPAECIHIPVQMKEVVKVCNVKFKC